jgi:hypothetical protein
VLGWEVAVEFKWSLRRKETDFSFFKGVFNIGWRCQVFVYLLLSCISHFTRFHCVYQNKGSKRCLFDRQIRCSSLPLPEWVLTKILQRSYIDSFRLWMTSGRLPSILSLVDGSWLRGKCLYSSAFFSSKEWLLSWYSLSSSSTRTSTRLSSVDRHHERVWSSSLLCDSR